MGAERRLRKRAVVLTDEGLELFSQRLLEAWKVSGLPGRFSRGACAILLQLGDKSVEKILKRQGNDLAVLVQAFANLGLPWDSSYSLPLEDFSARERVQKPLVSESASSDPTLDVEPPASEPAVRRVPAWVRPVRWSLGLLFVALVALGISLVTPKSKTPDPISRLARTATERLEAGRQAFLASNYQDARRLIGEAIVLADRHGIADTMAEGVRLQADVFAAQGLLVDSAARYRESLALYRAFDRPHGLGTLLEALGVAEARLGRLDEAERHLEESVAVLQQAGLHSELAGTLRSLGSVAALRGDRTRARRLYATAVAGIAHRPNEAMHLDLQALNALLDAEEGRTQEALATLEACLRSWETRGHPRWVAATWLQVAAIHARSGRSDLWRNALVEGERLYRQVGDTYGEEQCADWRRRGASTGLDLKRRIELAF